MGDDGGLFLCSEYDAAAVQGKIRRVNLTAGSEPPVWNESA
jgi:hypothetical protein